MVLVIPSQQLTVSTEFVLTTAELSSQQVALFLAALQVCIVQTPLADTLHAVYDCLVFAACLHGSSGCLL